MIRFKNSMFSTKKFFIIFLLLFLLVFPLFVLGTEIDWPTSPITGISLHDKSGIDELIAYVYGWGIGIGALLTFVMLVIAGIEWMVSGSNSALQNKARGRISSALIGLALLLSSWLILNTINPHLTVLTPLPPLWDEQMYDEVELLHEKEDLPCEFVIFYENPDFSGATSGPIYPKEEGYTNVNLLSEYRSGKSFRRMSQGEQKMLDEAGPEAFQDREIYDNKYIEPGPCTLMVYRKIGFFQDPCGKIIGKTPFPIHDILATLVGDHQDEITCFIIRNVN